MAFAAAYNDQDGRVGVEDPFMIPSSWVLGVIAMDSPALLPTPKGSA